MKSIALLASSAASLTSAGSTPKTIHATDAIMTSLLQENKIGTGVCQTMLGNNIYDLTKFDSVGRDLYLRTPAVIQNKDKTSAFAYKTCDASSEFTEP